MHLKLRDGGGGLALNTSAKSASTRRPKRQRIHSVPPPSSSEQPPTQLQVGGAFASQVHSSVSSGCMYPEASVGDGFSAADADADGGVSPGAEGAKPPGIHSSPSRTGFHGLSGSANRSPERQITAGGESLGFGSGGDGGDGCGDGRGRSGGTWTTATGGMDSPEQNASGSRWAGEDVGSSAAGWESAWDTERESRGLTGDAASRFPGSSARQDMPSGLKESVERLCAAAFLRGHVPEGLMPKGTTPAEAYQRYVWAKSHTKRWR